MGSSDLREPAGITDRDSSGEADQPPSRSSRFFRNRWGRLALSLMVSGMILILLTGGATWWGMESLTSQNRSKCDRFFAELGVAGVDEAFDRFLVDSRLIRLVEGLEKDVVSGWRKSNFEGEVLPDHVKSERDGKLDDIHEVLLLPPSLVSRPEDSDGQRTMAIIKELYLIFVLRESAEDFAEAGFYDKAGERIEDLLQVIAPRLGDGITSFRRTLRHYEQLVESVSPWIQNLPDENLERIHEAWNNFDPDRSMEESLRSTAVRYIKYFEAPKIAPSESSSLSQALLRIPMQVVNTLEESLFLDCLLPAAGDVSLVYNPRPQDIDPAGISGAYLRTLRLLGDRRKFYPYVPYSFNDPVAPEEGRAMHALFDEVMRQERSRRKIGAFQRVGVSSSLAGVRVVATEDEVTFSVPTNKPGPITLRFQL